MRHLCNLCESLRDVATYAMDTRVELLRIRNTKRRSPRCHRAPAPRRASFYSIARPEPESDASSSMLDPSFGFIQNEYPYAPTDPWSPLTPKSTPRPYSIAVVNSYCSTVYT